MEYRHIDCSKCKTTIRIQVSAQNYGRRVEVTCPICGAKILTTITAPVEDVKTLVNNLFSTILKVLDESPEYKEAEQALYKAVLMFRLILVAEIGQTSEEQKSEPEPQVQKDVRANFSSQDKTYWAKHFKIKLDD